MALSLCDSVGLQTLSALFRSSRHRVHDVDEHNGSVTYQIDSQRVRSAAEQSLYKL